MVLFHVAHHVNANEAIPSLIAATRFGHAGVDVFFVLSGFIILFVHRADIGRPERASSYMSRRFTRLMPIYWIALAITVAMIAVSSSPMPSTFAVLWSVTLLPSLYDPVLGIAWTLQHELVFYAAFLVLIANKAAGVAVMSAWLLWIMAVGLGLTENVFGLASSYNLQFFLGMGAAYLLMQGPFRRSGAMLLAGLVMLAMACVAESLGYLNGYAPSARLLYGVPAAIMVASVAALDLGGAPIGSRLAATSRSRLVFNLPVPVRLYWRGLEGDAANAHSCGVCCAVGSCNRGRDNPALGG